MLRVAVPNKGSLSEAAMAILHEAGYRKRANSKEFVVSDIDNDVEFFFLRPRDIAIYVSSEKVDLGVTGRDLLLDSGAAAKEVMALGFCAVHFLLRGRTGHRQNRTRPRREDNCDVLP